MFGGVTISKAAFINQRKPLSQEDRNEWQDVQILITDEISFMSDSVLKMLDIKLKDIGTGPIFLVGSPLYFQETSVNSNLFVVTKKNSYFQLYQVESGKTT